MDNPKKLAEQLEKSLTAAVWITEADGAAVALAFKLAHACDEVASRELAPLARLLADVLGDLGLTIAGRATKPEVPKTGSPLDALITAANGKPNPTPKVRPAGRPPKPRP